jgi:hypothetical protein
MDRQGAPAAWPPHSAVLNSLDFYLWGHLGTLVYAAPLDNEGAIHRRSYPGIFERMRRSLMRRIQKCTEYHAGHFYHQ